MTTRETLKAMSEQAKRWRPDSLILGNIKAEDVARACDEALAELEGGK